MNKQDTTGMMSAELIEMFYWGGVDHEDLYCVCGTPHPEQIFEDEFPAKLIRRCCQCGAVADLDEGSGEWIIRGEVRS